MANMLKKVIPIDELYKESLETIIDSSIPKGIIMWYYGTTAPTGWAICDGTNGTPNLIDKYIIGTKTSSYINTSVSGTYTIPLDGDWPMSTNTCYGHNRIRGWLAGAGQGADGHAINYLAAGLSIGASGLIASDSEQAAIEPTTRTISDDTIRVPSVRLLPIMKL